MQTTMHQEVGVVRRQRLALFVRFLRDHGGTQNQVSGDDRVRRLVKGQHVGGVILLTIRLVQGPPLLSVDNTHGYFTGLRI